MGRLDYAKLFFTGKKSTQMQSIERRFPELKGFYRKDSFFHAFGNLDLHDKNNNFLILLPANQKIEYGNNKNVFHLSCRLFAFYYTKKNPSVNLIENS